MGNCLPNRTRTDKQQEQQNNCCLPLKRQNNNPQKGKYSMRTHIIRSQWQFSQSQQQKLIKTSGMQPQNDDNQCFLKISTKGPRLKKRIRRYSGQSEVNIQN